MDLYLDKRQRGVEPGAENRALGLFPRVFSLKSRGARGFALIATISVLVYLISYVGVNLYTMGTVLEHLLGWDILWAAILVASIRALSRENLKARLAYSTISQLAYITLGAALATSSGILGAGMHIAMHAVGKITLFFCAGAIYVTAHKTEVSQLDGLGRRMPFTFLAFFVASLSIIGIPPTGGSWSKWYLLIGAAEGHQYVFGVVLMLSSLLSIGYLMPIVARAFFVDPPEDDHDTATGEAAPAMLLPLCATALGTLVLFFYAPTLRELLLPVAQGAGG